MTSQHFKIQHDLTLLNTFDMLFKSFAIETFQDTYNLFEILSLKVS